MSIHLNTERKERKVHVSGAEACPNCIIEARNISRGYQAAKFCICWQCKDTGYIAKDTGEPVIAFVYNTIG